MLKDYFVILSGRALQPLLTVAVDRWAWLNMYCKEAELYKPSNTMGTLKVLEIAERPGAQKCYGNLSGQKL